MTRKKLVLIKHKRMWEPVISILIERLFREPPRTDGKAPRSKIQLKFPKDFKHVVKWPKFIAITCEDENYVIREWRCFFLLDHLAEIGISKYSSRDIYRQRIGVMCKLDTLYKSLDNCVDLVEVEETTKVVDMVGEDV